MFKRNEKATVAPLNRGAETVTETAPATVVAAPDAVATAENTQAPQDTVVGVLAEDATGVDADGNDISLKAGEEVIVNAADIVEPEAVAVAPDAAPASFDPTKGISLGAAGIDSGTDAA